jgi:hypothetical protein
MNEWLVMGASVISVIIGYLLNSYAMRFLQRIRNSAISAVAYDIVKQKSNPFGKNINWWYSIKIHFGRFFLFLGLLMFTGGIFCFLLSIIKLIL